MSANQIPYVGQPDTVLPKTITGSTVAANAVIELLHQLQKEDPKEEGIITRFLKTHDGDDRRKDFANDLIRSIPPSKIHPYEMGIIARCAAQKTREFELFAPLLRWYLTAPVTLVHTSAYVFSLLLAHMEQSAKKEPALWQDKFIKEVLNMRPDLYWASDTLHRKQFETLQDFSAEKPIDDDRINHLLLLIPAVGRIVRRVVNVMDARYSELIEKCAANARILLAYVDRRKNPSLYELNGLFEWGQNELNCCHRQQLEYPLLQFQITLRERYQLVGQPRVSIEFQRDEPSADYPLSGYSYKGVVKIEIPEARNNPEIEEKWRKAKMDMMLDISVDCSTRIIPKSELRHTLRSTGIGAVSCRFQETTQSTHARVIVNAPRVIDGNEAGWFFQNLTFYLPQDQIPGLTSFNDATSYPAD